jgi:probable phosphoglycerate mutase
MTRIYLIRHGEAEGNLYRRAQGQYDSNITQLGRQQIAALAQRFRDIPIDGLWASDLCRAQSTAAAILKYHPHLVLHTTPRLREIGIGCWEDMPWGDIDRADHDQLELFTNDPGQWHVGGSESYEALIDRFKAVVLELAGANEGKTLALVAHGLGIRAFLCHCLGIASQDIGTLPYGDNSSVSLVEVEDGQIRVCWYNDNSHLENALSTFSRQSWWRQKKTDKKVYTHFEPLDPKQESELYVHCYSQTWQSSHGNLKGFSPTIYLVNAYRHSQYDRPCLMKLYWEDTFAGLIELDVERGRAEGVGWISLIYIEPELRQKRLGIQLIGHAVSYFRQMGRRAIRLHVSQTNDQALGFYRHNGFVPVGETEGVGGPLYLMELDIQRRIITPEEL